MYIYIHPVKNEGQNNVNFPDHTGEFNRGIVVKTHILGLSKR